MQQFFRITYGDSPLVLANQAKLADSFYSRILGLMFTDEMIGFDALIIRPCNSIHTFFMNYAIDVIFVDKENKIVDILRNYSPWRMSWMYFKAQAVIEFRAGTLPPELKIGDSLGVICIN